MEADTPIHATCVACQARAVLIKGASGQGKSALGLMLMAMGCTLVADDRTILHRDGEHVIATCPPPIRGMIEARGIGILNAVSAPVARVVLVVDLDLAVSERMPERRSVSLCGCAIPLIGNNPAPHFPAAILQILKAGWSDA